MYNYYALFSISNPVATRIKWLPFHQVDDGNTERNTASFHVLRKPNRAAKASAKLSGQVKDGRGNGVVRSASSELQDQ